MTTIHTTIQRLASVGALIGQRFKTRRGDTCTVISFYPEHVYPISVCIQGTGVIHDYSLEGRFLKFTVQQHDNDLVELLK